MTRLAMLWVGALLLSASSCGQMPPEANQVDPSDLGGEPIRTEFKPTGGLLQWEKGLVQSVKANLGDLRGSYFDQNRLISEQIFMGNGIPEAPNQRATLLADGKVLLAGCRHHSCDEKGAIVATPEGTMLAAGLINYRCIFDELIDRFCQRHPRLTIFVKYANDRPEITGHITAWAKEVSVGPYRPIALEERVHIDENRARRGAADR
jgi:hypothetical protein